MATISTLVRSCPALAPDVTVDEAANLFLSQECIPFLSLPVVDQGRPVGVLSRHQLQHIFMSRYGRELYGRRPVSAVMNTRAVTIERASPVEIASQTITENIRLPIQEDFVITDNGLYAGVGVVIDLLKVMEQRISRRNEEIAAAYQQLQQQQAHLVQSEKMASLGQMVAGVAHELNTPLGYVRNNVEMICGLVGSVRSAAEDNQRLLTMLADENADPEMLAGLVEAALSDTNRHSESLIIADLGQLLDDTLYGCNQIGELVCSLKDFSRLDRESSEKININDCVNGALLIARNMLKERIEVVRDTGDLPAISCMPSQINQVLLNLVTNAAQAIEGAGRIEIRTRHTGGAITILIRDSGKGIPPENIKRVFDPFFTTKPVGQGTGLGLAICYRIIQEHGGSINVSSTVGIGTEFFISLPVTSVSTMAPASIQHFQEEFI